MYMCVYIYSVCNPEMMHQNILVLEYSIQIVNPERSLERNSKPW